MSKGKQTMMDIYEAEISLVQDNSNWVCLKIKLPSSPVDWGCRICWQVCREVRPHPPIRSPGYETKQSDSEVLVQELWGMWSTLSLPLLIGLLCSGEVVLEFGGMQSTPSLSWLLGPLRPGVEVSVRVQSMGQIELFNYLQINDWC